MSRTSTTDQLEAYRLLLADVYELAEKSRQSSDTLARQLDQTAARWHVLSVLSDAPRTVPSAGRRLGLTRQSVQRVVDGLTEDELVERQRNPDHATAPLISLTAQGRTVLHGLTDCGDTAHHDLLTRAQVDQTDLHQARQTLQRLLAALKLPDANGDQ